MMRNDGSVDGVAVAFEHLILIGDLFDDNFRIVFEDSGNIGTDKVVVVLGHPSFFVNILHSIALVLAMLLD